MSLFALIPAAGSGARPARRPKQYAALAGQPMLWHAIRAVCVPAVLKVFVVLAPDDRLREQDWSAFGGRLEPLYCGGAAARIGVQRPGGFARSRRSPTTGCWCTTPRALPSAERTWTGLIARCEGDEVGGILAFPWPTR